MGCLLIVASVMMCLLAHRLNRVAIAYKVVIHTVDKAVMHDFLQREKADSVLQTHRQRYGIEPGGGGLFRSEA